jgi:hypothetical protein
MKNKTPNGWIPVDVALPVASWNGPWPLTWYLVTDGFDVYKALLDTPLPAFDDPSRFMRADCTPLVRITHWRPLPALPAETEPSHALTLQGAVRTLIAGGTTSFIDPEVADKRYVASSNWLRRIEALKAGDACEVLVHGRWEPCVVRVNGKSALWTFRHAADEHLHSIHAYIEHVRCPGQTEAWPGRTTYENL